MKRVGIITLYYKNYNYGGQLGAYALQKAIAKLGFYCEQITFKWLNEHTLQAYESAKSAEHFSTFSESIPHSERLYTVSDIAECVDIYDIFVCGSDKYGVYHGLFPMAFYPVWHFLLFQHQKRKLHMPQAWEEQK